MNTLQIISALFVVAGLLSALLILLDLRRHPQPMPVMRSVWVLTGLWAGPFGLLLYRRLGRTADAPEPMPGMPSARNMPHSEHARKMEAMHDMADEGEMPGMHMPAGRPGWPAVVRSTLHCGAGCTLADLIGEWFLYFVPVSVGGSLAWGGRIVDYLLALAIGVCFQFAAIRSMQRISPLQAFEKALKADFLSLTAWQIGMYCWTAAAAAAWPRMMAERTSWSFWFSIQIGMLCGFICAYPVNILLIRAGIKNAME